MIELELSLDRKSKPVSRWQIAFFTAAIVFLLTTIQNLGLKGINILSPLPFQDRSFEKILPKLEEKSNKFKVKRTATIVQSASASNENLLSASSYLAINFDTGEVLIEKNTEKELPIASLTKVMTAVVALDLADPSEEIRISQNSTRAEPTKIGVVQNQKMTVKELLNATLLTSANDAAQALQDGIDDKYGSNVFIKAMNAKARFLGLSNTSFSNPQGFDSRTNYSTVQDLANLTHYALTNYPILKKIVEKDYEFLPKNINHKQFDLYNWNGLLGTYPGVKGVKIGNTGSAGYTTIVLSEREGKKVLVVLLGAPGVLERDLWASQILDNAFEKLGGLSRISLTEFDLRQKYSTWKYWN